MSRSYTSAAALPIFALSIVVAACHADATVGPAPVTPTAGETATTPAAPTTTATAPVLTAPPDTSGVAGGTTTTPMPVAGGDFFACTSDADCVVVAKNSCCNNGHIESVAKTKADAYKASFTCDQPKAVCPHYKVNDTRTAICDTKVNHCALSEKK